MTVDGLEDRTRSWLQTEYRAILFEEGSEALGYALFKQDPDWIYLRQFFVCRERRRQGIGRNAMRWLLANVWNDAERVRLDVLIGNSAAIQFWQSVGFAGYCVTMER
jgi:GNAT superfamily N-acetyltransferase